MMFYLTLLVAIQMRKRLAPSRTKKLSSSSEQGSEGVRPERQPPLERDQGSGPERGRNSPPRP